MPGGKPNDPDRYFDQGVAIPDPRIPDVDTEPVPDWAKGMERSDDPAPPYGELKSGRQSDDLFYRQSRPAGEGAQWYPLAKMRVNPGEIGFIYHIQTQLNGFDGEENRIWYRNADPISFIYEVPGMTPDAAPRWRLTLEPRRAGQTQRTRRMLGLYPGPQPVHPDLPEWRDGRFVFNANSVRTKLMIPENTTARLWVGFPIPEMTENQVPSLMSARLVGFVQSWTDNPEARTNARRLF